MSDGEFQIPDELRRRIEAGEDLFPEKTARAREILANAGLPKNWETISESKKRKGIMTGIDLIAQKRLDQKIKHGHSIRSDYESYPDFELMEAAQAILEANPDRMPKTWDEESCKRLCGKPLQERLITAGAMIAAQIDVLNYKEND